jgi:hypothetical protein
MGFFIHRKITNRKSMKFFLEFSNYEGRILSCCWWWCWDTKKNVCSFWIQDNCSVCSEEGERNDENIIIIIIERGAMTNCEVQQLIQNVFHD